MSIEQNNTPANTDAPAPAPAPAEPPAQAPAPVNPTLVIEEEYAAEERAAVEQPVAEPQVPPLPYTTAPKAENVQQDFSISKEGTEDDTGKITMGVETIALPAVRSDVERANLNHQSAGDMEGVDGQRWLGVMTGGDGVRVHRNVLTEAVDRLNSNWLQGLKLETGRLSYFAPRIGEKEGTKLTGQNALMRMRAIMGMGGLVTVPLYHSGFHITLKTPKDADYLTLREQNEMARVRLGRATFGMIYSSTSGYLVENIVQMIAEHTHSTTIKDTDNILSKISVLDLPILIWGLACTIWPKGFQYARAIVTGEQSLEPKIITGMIDVAKLLWVDNSAFTERQKAQLSNRQLGQTTDDVLNLYREQFVSNAGAVVEFQEGAIKLNLRVPSIADYIESTHNWIDSLAAIVDQTFTGDRTDHEGRSRSMMNHANLSRMRQYGHWVKSIVMNDVTYDEQEEISNMLQVLSEDEQSREKYFSAVDAFINKATVAVIGIPETSGKTTNLPAFPRIIPIDVVGTFFTLLMYRLSRNLPDNG